MQFRRLDIFRLLLLTGVAMQAPAFAADDPVDMLIDESNVLRAELDKKKAELDALERRLVELEARIARIEPARADQGVSPHPDDLQAAESQTTDVAAGPRQQGGGLAAETADTSVSDSVDPLTDREQQRLIRSALESTLIDRGGLLLPAWTYSIEPSYSYIHSSAENIVVDGFTIFPVLVVGDIVSERVVRDLSMANLTLRLGLPWNAQAELRIPYGHQKFRGYSADGTEEKLNDHGLGDIELGLSTQVYQSKGRWPDVEASLRYKSSSGNNPFTANEGDIFVGTGHESANILFTAVKVSDPVVYFGGFDYTRNFSSDQAIGKYEPGDSWGFNLGMAIALNLQNSLSFSYDQHFTRYSRLDGIRIPGSYATTGVFQIGSTYAISDRAAIDFSIGVGITEDSPDLLFSMTLPMYGEL